MNNVMYVGDLGRANLGGQWKTNYLEQVFLNRFALKLFDGLCTHCGGLWIRHYRPLLPPIVKVATDGVHCPDPPALPGRNSHPE